MKGDIVYITFPFTDLTGTKLRPALVIKELNQDIVVHFITSKLHQFDASIDLIVQPDSQNGLKKPSVFKVTKLVCLNKKLIRTKIGVLDSNNLANVHQKIISGLSLI